MIAAGEKDNVLPGEGRALADIRILPGDSVAGVLAHVRRVVADPAVEIRTVLKPVEPSPVAPVNRRGFVEVAAAARRVFPEALVAPGLLVAGTDSKHYLPWPTPCTASVRSGSPGPTSPGSTGSTSGSGSRRTRGSWPSTATCSGRAADAAGRRGASCADTSAPYPALSQEGLVNE